MLDMFLSIFQLQQASADAMAKAGFTADQIETVIDINKKYPHFSQNIDMKFLLQEEHIDTRNRLLEFMEDDDLVERFAAATENNPAAMDNINYLIANDPDRLFEIAQRTQDSAGTDNEVDIINELAQSVTDEQRAAYAQALAEQHAADEASLMQKVLSGDFSFSNIEGGALGMLGKIITGLKEMIAPLLDGLTNSLRGAANSDAAITAGNGRSDGPLAQFSSMIGLGNLFDQDGNAAKPAPDAPAATAQQPQNEHDPNQPSRDMGITLG